MSSYSSDRRSVLRIIGAIGATCAYPFASDDLHGQTVDTKSEAVQPHQHATPDQPAQPQFFNQRDFETVSRITNLIIPDTDTPGAIGAGVPRYLDLVVGRSAEQQLLAADGLRWLDNEAQRVGNKNFIELTEEQQLGILEPLCEASEMEGNTSSKGRNVQFFSLMKSLTADGYYTSRIGLLEELQYKGDTMRTSYPICSR